MKRLFLFSHALYLFIIFHLSLTGTAQQIINPYGGTGAFASTGDGGPALLAGINGPIGIIMDNAGTLYLSDAAGSRIRKIDASGIITSIGGNGIPGYSGDGGPALSAQLGNPAYMVFDKTGNLLFIDNAFRVIRKIDMATGIISTITGNGPFLSPPHGDGGLLVNAKFRAIQELYIDNAGNLYIADIFDNVVRKVNTAGIITLFAGNYSAGFSGDGGLATNAQLNYPTGISSDNAGNIYIVDNHNNRVRKVDPSGIITTIAGTGVSAFGGDGGPATAASFINAWDIITDANDTLFISDRGGYIRKIAPNGIITTEAGNGVAGNTGDGGLATAAQIDPLVLALDNQHHLFMSDVDHNVIRVIGCFTTFMRKQPRDTIICNTGNIQFIADASYFPNFQWQVNTGSGWNDISNNAIYTGATNDTLSVAATAALNGYQYRCHASNYCSAISSTIATLTVTTPSTPVIAIMPSAATICAATNVTFNAAATNGGSAPVYQWKKNGSNVGAGSNIYTDNTLINGDVISCVLTSNATCAISPTATSNNVVMTVNAPVTPSILVSNPATTICAGANAAFSTAITNGGAIPVYQWKKNGLPVGANSPAYTDNTLANGDMITCQLTSNATCLTTATVTSSPVSTVVNPNPVVALDQTSSICDGSIRRLDAGSFASYIWSDGSSGQTIDVNNTGTYSVTVTDNNGCKGNGTTVISTLLPRPSSGLQKDTSFCITTPSLQLTANPGFTDYNWSDSTGSATITITQPGIYWIDMTDNNSCTGRDSITVATKECLKGFYIPNAFTPNRDGINDTFRPLLYGNIKAFQFTIYDRWGMIVFRSTDPGKGWDGTQSGVEKSAAAYVWICSYLLEGQTKKVEKGTVVLIR